MKTLRNFLASNRIPTFVILAVSPLLFLTDLTRNPYQIQITILNLSLLWISALRWLSQIKNPQELLECTSTEMVFLALIAWAGMTIMVSWIHNPLFRAPIFYQGLKGWLFMAINGYLAFQMGRQIRREPPTESVDISAPKILWVAILWSVLWLPYHALKSGEGAIWDPYGALVWALLLLMFFLWFKPDSPSWALSMILFVGVVAGGYSIIQHFGRDVIWGSVLDPYGGRPISTFGNPNFLSSCLVMMLPITVTLIMTSRNRIRLVSSGLLCLLIGVSLLYTSTRTSWAGGLVSLVILGVLCWKDLDSRQLRALRAVALSGLVFLVLWLASPWRAVILKPLSRGQDLFVALKTGRADPAINQRLLIWNCAWDMIRKNPWLGIGWGCFEMFYPFYQGPLLFNPTLNYRTHANNAHNLILELGSQIGLVGLGLFIWLLLLVFRSVWEARKNHGATSRILLSGILAGCTGMIADNIMGNVSLFFAAPAFLFWWLLGLGNGMAREPVIISIRRPVVIIRIVAMLLIAGSFGVGFWTWQRLRADEFFYAGFKLSKGGKTSEAIPYLERSSFLDGSDVDNAYELGNNYAQEARVLQASRQPELAREKHEQAIHAYGLAIKANPGYDEIYYNRATELASLGKLEEAYNNLTFTLWINPLYRNAYTMLANVAQTLPVWNAETLSLLRNGLLFYPADVDLMNATGYFLVSTHQWDEARDMFERCLAIDPHSTISRNNLNNILTQLQQSK